MKNRIAKLIDIRKIAFVEEMVPKLKEEEILVKVRAVGICGSDMHYFLEGGLGSFKQKLPMDIGHEASGVVREVAGKSVFKRGDRVAIEPGRPCFFCEWCLKGRHNLCINGKFMVANSQGALAEYVVVHKSQVAKIPDSMSFPAASLLEPLGVGMHAVNMVGVRPTMSVAIIGSGPIGLSLMLVLQKFGVKNIFMVDKLPYRVKFAKKMGAETAVLFSDAVSQIKEFTHNLGVDIAFDTGGSQESISACTDVVATGGAIGLVGIPTDDFMMYNPHKLRTKEVTIKNIRRSNQTLHDCIQLFSDEKKLDKMVTHEFELKDAQKAFDLVGTYGDGVVKCVITMGAD